MSLTSLLNHADAPLGAEPTENEHYPIHHLFSPTSLVPDLTYVDKTYYSSYSPFPFPTILLQCLSKSMQDLSKMTEINYGPIISTFVFNNAFPLFKSISHLNLHDVELSVVPSQLGHLTRLTFLDLSNNRICQLPNSTCELKHLRHLNISNNLFKETPNAIPFLSKLMHLDMSYNPLEELSADIAQLNNLTMLDLTSTNIRNVPYEILRVNPLSIKVDDCPNIAERHMSFKASLQYNPPSLLETCARILIRPLCEGPYYDACVFRYRIVHRSDSTYLPIEYRLCSAHWSNEKDRIVAMFSTPPSTTLPRYKKGRELRYTIPSL